jgi:putative spermidine/putrescine transport system permease protein
MSAVIRTTPGKAWTSSPDGDESVLLAPSGHRPRFGLRSRLPRGLKAPGVAWLGLAPFLLYIGIFFLLPTGTVVWAALRRTDRATRRTAFTSANMSDALHGVYRTAIINSIELSLLSAGIAVAVGLPLAWAVVSSSGAALPRLVSTAAAVFANFGGVPLAFLFIATVGNAGVLTTALQRHLGLSLREDLHFTLYSFSGLTLVYLYFLIPLLVLVITPALEGLKPQWQEAAQGLGASRWQYWRHVAGPVLAPNVLGALLLLFCSAFSAFATADAMTSGTFAIIPLRINAVLSGNVISGQENLGDALALIMIIIVIPLTVAYQLLQRRTSRWLR